MQFLLLGPFEVRDGERVVPVPRRKHRALLALLVLRAGERVSTDALLEELWGAQPPRTALGALRNYVSQLRKLLGEGVIETRGDGYVARVDAGDVDALRFEALAAGANSAADRAAALRAALALWRGPALADLLYEPFAAAEAGRLEELRLAAHEDLLDAELELGNHRGLVPELETLVAEHPFRERLHGQLMLALYRSGRQADALGAYRQAREVLVGELGIDPGIRLRELEQAILRQDPGLDLPAVLPPVAERRKTVTVLCWELAQELEGLDPERLRRETVHALTAARAAIEEHGGSVETRSGDELLGVFGVPAAHEDDALRAVRAAARLRGTGARIGVDTGGVLVGNGFVSGNVVARGKRLQRAAAPGEALVGAATVALCGAAVQVEVAGDAFRLLGAEETTVAIPLTPDAPLVGRQAQLGALRDVWARVCADGVCRLVAVVGEPGIGKSRLARELVAGLEGEATVLVGRCVSYGEGAAWLPVAEILERTGERLDPILERAKSPGEVFLAVRQVLERAARERPLVVALDDLHWAEETLLELVDYLAERAEGPILLLCLTRPELIEAWRPDARIELGPLTDRQAARLAEAAAPELRTQVVAAGGGNPLFLEQLVAYAADQGRLDAAPPSLEALIAARLDGLPEEDFATLQRASVIGRLFRPDDLEGLGGDPALLAGLQERGLLRRFGAGLGFHHVLVRDVAYASLPKAGRADLHERLADRLDARGDPGELVGYHLEQAYRYLSELGQAEGRAARLALDAGARLGAAGIAAWKRGEASAAVNLLGRAAEALPTRDRDRLRLLCELGPALRTCGKFDRARAVLAEAVAVAGDPPTELRARLELAGVRIATADAQSADELLDVAAEGLPVFEAVGDDRSLARAWRWIAYVHGSVHSRLAASSEAAEHALELYARTGWSTSSCLSYLAIAYHSGPTEVSTAIDGCRALLDGADFGGRAVVLSWLGGLEAMAGHFDEARTLVDQAGKLLEALGQVSIARVPCFEAYVERLAGQPARAEQALRASVATLREMGSTATVATQAAELAGVLLELGRDDEAGEWCTLAEATGAADDFWTQTACRGARARLLARRGDLAPAEALAREVVALTEASDALNHRAKAQLDLAEVLRLGGRHEEAARTVEDAIAVYREKGNVAGASLAASVLAGLAPA
jgi:DNA-binding SARP family transcriptional activator/tetratricopeptide (TPR) repeat protein